MKLHTTVQCIDMYRHNRKLAAMATGALKKWGNSQGITIPKNMCNHLGIKPGDKLAISLSDDKILIEPEREFTLQSLMKDYAGPAPETYDWGKPMGRELW